MDILRLQNVSKDYTLKGETIKVLQGIDLTISAGEFVALMGPSGSGKTTLLHIMGGVDQPTGGKVFLGGKEISGLSAGQLAEVRLHRLGFIFQSYNLLPALTVFDNCAYPLILQALPGKERKERVERMLDRVGLSHRLKHRPEDLSGGNNSGWPWPGP